MISHPFSPTQIFICLFPNHPPHHHSAPADLFDVFRAKAAKGFPGFHQHTAIQSSKRKERCPAAADQNTMTMRMQEILLFFGHVILVSFTLQFEVKWSSLKQGHGKVFNVAITDFFHEPQYRLEH